MAEATLVTYWNLFTWLMLDGLASKVIASRMRANIHTVKTHVYNLFRTMDVRSRHQLVPRVTTADHEAR
ncbi:MAG: LuxR C-terminal-related transcriptional regulator [Thermoanaerobaculaceae bacterium]